MGYGCELNEPGRARALARAPAVGYKAERSTTDPKKIAAHHKGSITPLNELTQIIFLKRV
jgi:hypothetical protein